MGDLNSIGGAIHSEETKVEGFFSGNVKAAVIGTAVAVALISAVIFHFF